PGRPCAVCEGHEVSRRQHTDPRELPRPPPPAPRVRGTHVQAEIWAPRRESARQRPSYRTRPHHIAEPRLRGRCGLPPKYRIRSDAPESERRHRGRHGPPGTPDLLRPVSSRGATGTLGQRVHLPTLRGGAQGGLGYGRRGWGRCPSAATLGPRWSSVPGPLSSGKPPNSTTPGRRPVDLSERKACGSSW